MMIGVFHRIGTLILMNVKTKEEAEKIYRCRRCLERVEFKHGVDAYFVHLNDEDGSYVTLYNIGRDGLVDDVCMVGEVNKYAYARWN